MGRRTAYSILAIAIVAALLVIAADASAMLLSLIALLSMVAVWASFRMLRSRDRTDSFDEYMRSIGDTIDRR